MNAREIIRGKEEEPQLCAVHCQNCDAKSSDVSRTLLGGCDWLHRFRPGDETTRYEMRQKGGC